MEVSYEKEANNDSSPDTVNMIRECFAKFLKDINLKKGKSFMVL